MKWLMIYGIVYCDSEPLLRFESGVEAANYLESIGFVYHEVNGWRKVSK